MSDRPAFVCLSHLRWDFVFQRPNHLMTRAARGRRVFFVEEPMIGARTPVDSGDRPTPALQLMERDGVTVVRPWLPPDLDEETTVLALQSLFIRLLREQRIAAPVLWYYTPMALRWTRHVTPSAVVYDCMDQLSAFLGAPRELIQLEAELLDAADTVFTGGYRLHTAKKTRHPNVYPFPSAVDVRHFAQARKGLADPADQAAIPHPRLGFFGVVDERMDLDLVDGVAALRPDWQLVIVGPRVKIPAESLPDRPNIHYIGQRTYDELPAYLGGWDVAIMPFARNAATDYISPTKTPEYLAGRRPVVSTSIHDVVESYGKPGYVRIADTPADFVAAAEAAMAHPESTPWRAVDKLLSRNSWDHTWHEMENLVDQAVAHRRAAAAVASGDRRAVRRDVVVERRRIAPVPSGVAPAAAVLR